MTLTNTHKPHYVKCLETGQLAVEVVDTHGLRHTIQRSTIHSLHEQDGGNAMIHTHTYMLETPYAYPVLNNLLWPTNEALDDDDDDYTGGRTWVPH